MVTDYIRLIAKLQRYARVLNLEVLAVRVPKDELKANVPYEGLVHEVDVFTVKNYHNYIPNKKNVVRIYSNEHNAWWARNEIGYVKNIKDAGLYEYDRAFQICMSANIGTNEVPNESMVPVQ